LSPLVALVNLQFLDCSSTKVSNLAPLANLSNLMFLNVGKTRLKDYYRGKKIWKFFGVNTSAVLAPLANLSRLEQLDCYSTRVADLSPILPLIEKGIPVKWQNFSEYYREDESDQRERRYILVKDCPLANPPVKIVKQGNQAILRYFRKTPSLHL